MTAFVTIALVVSFVPGVIVGHWEELIPSFVHVLPAGYRTHFFIHILQSIL